MTSRVMSLNDAQRSAIERVRAAVERFDPDLHDDPLAMVGQDILIEVRAAFGYRVDAADLVRRVAASIYFEATALWLESIGDSPEAEADYAAAEAAQDGLGETLSYLDPTDLVTALLEPATGFEKPPAAAPPTDLLIDSLASAPHGPDAPVTSNHPVRVAADLLPF